MKKFCAYIFTFFSLCVANAQISTSELTIEETNDLTSINGNLKTTGKTTYLWGAGSNEYQALMFAGWGVAHGGLFWKGQSKTFMLNTGNDNTDPGAYGSANLQISGDLDVNGKFISRYKTAYLWGANGNEHQALMFSGFGSAHGGLYWKGEDKTFTINTGNHNTDQGAYGNANLVVNGAIRGITLHTATQDWSDFVFDADYELLPLQEVEKYIDTHKHLPDIPSESEVLENGIDVAEMNAKLLQKIEELTLYLIQQDKALKTANQNIQELQRKLLTQECE